MQSTAIASSLVVLGLWGGFQSVERPINANGSKETLKSLIFQGEAGKRGYNAYNRGSSKCRGSAKRYLHLTSMSMADLQYYQQKLPSCHPQKILAAGHYQTIPDTLDLCVKQLNLPSSTLFSKTTQDRIFYQCLAGTKQPAIKRYITTGNQLKQAAHAVAEEWAIFASPYTGRGVHDGKGINRARIDAKQVLMALMNARSTYTQQIAKGVSHDSAYALALGVY